MNPEARQADFWTPTTAMGRGTDHLRHGLNGMRVIAVTQKVKYFTASLSFRCNVQGTGPVIGYGLVWPYTR